MGYDARQWIVQPHTDYLRYEPDWSGMADSMIQSSQRSKDNEYRNATLEREKERDKNNDERARVGEKQRSQEMLMNDRRSGQREDLYRLQENRRENEARFNRDRLTKAEHEAALHELYAAINTPGQDPLTQQNRVRAAQDALRRAGYVTEEVEDTPSGPTAPQLDHTGQPPVAQPGPGAAPRNHLSTAQTQQTSRELDQAGASYMGKLTGGKKTAMPSTKSQADARTSKELDAIESKYMGALDGPPSVTGWLPGQPVTPRRVPVDVAQSDAMLDPDDPYNQIVK